MCRRGSIKFVFTDDEIHSSNISGREKHRVTRTCTRVRAKIYVTAWSTCSLYEIFQRRVYVCVCVCVAQRCVHTHCSAINYATIQKYNSMQEQR